MEAEVNEGRQIRRDAVATVAATAALVAKDLRALASQYDSSGPGLAAVLRSFAARLDGGVP